MNPTNKEILFDQLETEIGYYATMTGDSEFEIKLSIKYKDGNTIIKEI